MLVPFDQLPDESRVWIYQSNRKISDEELEFIKNKLDVFVGQWSAHGTPLRASYTIEYNRFVIIAVDETEQQVTGCSIDASVAVIIDIQNELTIDLLDKLNVTYKIGEHIAHKSLIDFKKMAKDKAVTSKTIVFNNLVTNIGEWREFWEIPAEESWHKRFF